ncbi:PAS domain S-box protein [Brevundimonas sp.]|uniref:PAS domain S-box protein n=1 Tax=Brevundimonas sp. TaxID=1871086 RepID=UPI002623BAEB|nr:PAS domain S-box protein [Brevundimonas sp.]
MRKSHTFQQLTELAATLFDAPMALIRVEEEDRRWFGARLGFSSDQIPCATSFCAHMAGSEPGTVLVVEDASVDPRFATDPLVVEAGVRFGAGALITREDGETEGAICVFDTVARGTPTRAQIESLGRLAAMVGREIGNSRLLRDQAKDLEMLALAEDMSGVGRWRLNLEDKSVSWSDAVYRIHGRDRATFDPGQCSFLVDYHPEDRDLLTACVERAIMTGQGYDLELRLVGPTCDGRRVATRARVETDEAGVPVGLIGVFQDITERVEAEQVLRASETRYRLLADNATDVIATYALDGRFTYVSPSIEGPMGYRPDDLVGRAFSDFMHTDDVARVREVFMTLRRSPQGTPSTRVRYRGIRKDGLEVWLEAHPRMIRDAQGRPLEYHDVVRDISETHLLETELIEARDRAEAGARAKSEFLANMSHELRTPLTSVIGFSGLLQASPNLGPDERRHVDRIATASEALLGVINDILDYSKLEAEAVDLEQQAFDPRAMAHDAAAIVESQCRAKGLELRIELADDLPGRLVGDGGRLRQVTLNFLSNAVKFTARGSVTLSVTAPDGVLSVAVTDTGIGLAPEKVEQLFERFTQADASTTRVYGGTGLGLAISRRLIGMMGGEIGARGTPGGGATFWFQVPLAVADAGTIAAGAAEDAASTTLRVLIADDVAANRELVSAILAGVGMTVDTVENGAEALEAARRGVYDLILMDVHMPEMDGLEATRAIRSLEGDLARVPIVALTASVQPEQVARCREAGMDGHVGKPIQVPQLLSAMAAATRSLPPEARRDRLEA